jgi:hypothetical protein
MSSNSPPHFKWIWKSACQARHKFFFWLLIHDGVNTMNLLEMKQMILQSYKCATLNYSQEETLYHLFLDCPFANACRDIVCSKRTKNMAISQTFLDIKEKLNVPFFMEIIILAAWSI